MAGWSDPLVPNARIKVMRSVIILLATAAFIAAPFVTPPFTGYDPGLFPVSIARPSIQPAGYAFAIWGVIYLWLAVSAVFGLTRRDDPSWRRTDVWHVGALILGTLWLAIANDYPLTATFTIIVMAGFTLAGFLAASPTKDRWWLQAPLGLFAGWLTAASMVSLGVVVSGYGLLSDTATALVMLAVILGVAVLIQTRRPTMPTYSATVVWAAIGVAVVNWSLNPPVAYAALLGAAVQTAVAARAFFRR
jgi:hypothetical protein